VLVVCVWGSGGLSGCLFLWSWVWVVVTLVGIIVVVGWWCGLAAWVMCWVGLSGELLWGDSWGRCGGGLGGDLGLCRVWCLVWWGPKL